MRATNKGILRVLLAEIVDRRCCRLAVLMLSYTALVTISRPAGAFDATWSPNPGSSDFNTGTNWVGNAVPDGTATFGSSTQTAVTLTTGATIGGWTFNSGAPAYSFTNNNTFATLSFTGAGIVINGGSATITNNGVSGISFFNTSTAGSATITNNAGSGIRFNDTSTAGSATITNNSGINFDNTSTAGSATITNNTNAFLVFFNHSTAGSATITNNGGSVSFGFANQSTAGSATIINNGLTQFRDQSTGGTARFINGAAGSIDLSNLSSSMTAGSIEGAGSIFLGANNLAVGGNNLSTTFSGHIQDGGLFGGTGGSLTKTGTGAH